MKKLLPFIFILGIVIVFFGQFFIKGLVAIPADSLVGLYHPFRDFLAKDYSRGYPFKNFLITDPVLQQYPWKQLAINSEKKGDLPLWNPYSGAGEPLLANIQSSALYPLNILLFVFPFMQGWMALIILQMLLGGIFMYFFLRNTDLKKESAIFGSLSFVLSGFYFAWLEWGNILHTALWLPLILLSIDKIVIQDLRPKIKDLNLKSLILNLRWPLVFIFALTASFLAGHLQIFFYTFLISLFYFVFRVIKAKQRLKNIVIFVGSFSLFVVITFIQWFPSLNLILLSSRSIDQMNWQTKEGWFIPWQHLVQFIAPDFFGNPTTLNYWGTWNYAELVGYIGIITLCFAVFSILVKKEKIVWFFFISILIALIFALPNAISKIPFEFKIPLISSSQPTRLIFIIDFSLAVLAAFGVEEFLKRGKNIRLLVASSLLITLTVAGVWFYLLLNKGNLDLLISQRNFYVPTMLAIGQIIILILAYVLRSKKKIFLSLFYILLFINIFDLMRYGLKFNPFVPSALVFPDTKITTFLSSESQKYPWRSMGTDYVKNEKRIFPPNTSVNYKIFGIDNYNPLLLKNYQEFIAVSEWGFSNIPQVSFNRIIIPNNYDSRLIDLLGVKYVVAINDTYSTKLKFLFREGDSRVYENLNVLPRAFMAYSFVEAKTKQKAGAYLLDKKIDLRKTVILDSKVNISESTNTASKVSFINYMDNSIRLSVETARRGILVLTDNYYPGWTAFIDGKQSEILKVDYTFRGLIVPEGRHIVEFRFNLL